MMYTTVIGQAFVLLIVLQLSTMSPIPENEDCLREYYQHVELGHLEWGLTRRFCGRYKVAVLLKLCGYRVIFDLDKIKEDALDCCQNECSLRKLKALYCNSNFDARPYINISAEEIQHSVQSYPTEEPSILEKFVKNIYEILPLGKPVLTAHKM